jgi:hypothetical protein
MATMAVEELQE